MYRPIQAEVSHVRLNKKLSKMYRPAEGMRFAGSFLFCVREKVSPNLRAPTLKNLFLDNVSCGRRPRTNKIDANPALLRGDRVKRLVLCNHYDCDAITIVESFGRR